MRYAGIFHCSAYFHELCDQSSLARVVSSLYCIGRQPRLTLSVHVAALQLYQIAIPCTEGTTYCISKFMTDVLYYYKILKYLMQTFGAVYS